MAMRNPIHKGRKNPHDLAKQTEAQEGKKGKQTRNKSSRASKAGFKGQERARRRRHQQSQVGESVNNLPDDIQCAFVEGLHDQAYCFWSHKVQTWLQLQSTALNIEDEYVSVRSLTMPKPFTDKLFTRLAIM